MWKSQIFYLVSFAIVYSVPLIAADSIWINGVELRVGMEKSQVLAKLANKFNYSALKFDGEVNPKSDLWCLKSKTDRSAGLCGDDLVQFYEERLVKVSKRLGGSSDDAATKMIAALHATLNRHDKAELKKAGLHVWSAESSQGLLKEITLQVAGLTYSMFLIQGIGQSVSSVYMEEVIERWPSESKRNK